MADIESFAEAHRYPGGFEKWVYDKISALDEEVSALDEEVSALHEEVSALHEEEEEGEGD